MSDREQLRTSPVYTRRVIEEIQDKAQLGRYRIRGFGTLRERPLPSLDDLTFLPASLTRIPLSPPPAQAGACPADGVTLDVIRVHMPGWRMM